LENFIRSRFYIEIILWALIIVGLLVNVALIAGVLKDQPKFFLPYLIFSWGELVFVIIRIVHNVLNERNLGDVDVFQFVTPLVTIYFIICVYSYYVDVKKQKKETKETVILPTKA
jgi:hypothetical protein